MGAKAVEELLTKTNITPEEVDLIICATVTPDHVFPSTANIIGDMVGAKNAWSFDVNAACSGFLYALTTGSQFIETGKYKKVIIVGGDKMSSIIDYTDRTTCVIFGDGAGAVMLEATEDENIGIKDSILYSDGAGKKHLYQKSGGSVSPATEETVKNREHFVYQEGQPVFKAAVTGMADVSAEIMEKNNLQAEDVSWLVPHQANLRIIDATARRMGLSTDKVMINIQKYGNTTAGTIPLCLADWESQLKKGDNIILSTFGGGFTWGAMYLTWGYNSK
jgi:3-oxoacyl-[acyl-carrier-protein] synthase-3